MNKLTSLEELRLQRALCVQALYQISDPHATKVVDEAVENAIQSGNYPDQDPIQLKKPQRLKDLVGAIVEKTPQIDQLISNYLGENWNIRRLNHIDLAILRLGVYEMLYVDDEKVPPLVAISEAVELAKIFSDDKSRSFINGVLNKILEEHV